MSAHPLRSAASLLGGIDRPRCLLLAVVALVFGGAILVLGGLGFPLRNDEYWFWRQTLFFVERWPPGLAELRNYREPMTPLTFLVWATVERATGAGVVAGRVLNIALSVALLLVIGARRRDPEGRGLRAACGLLIFPYTVPLSIHLYTDLPAAFLVVLGLWLYALRRPVWSAVVLALAIATRQYMVVFPLALAASELAPALLGRGTWSVWRTLPPLAAAATLGGWILFFGGLGPQAGLEDWPRHVDALTRVVPAYGLYALTCLGAYFVVPELVLFRRWRERPMLLSARHAWAGAGMVVLFALFPPTAQDVTMGPLNRATLAVLPPEVFGLAGAFLRNALFALLAWAAVLRFARLDLAGWIVLGHVALMTVSFESWEKYHLPVLAALWYLASHFRPEQPIDLWNVRPVRIGGIGGEERGADPSALSGGVAVDR